MQYKEKLAVFFKKRKAAKQKLANDRLSEETRIKSLIAEAAEMTDPAEKLLKLEEIRNDAYAILNAENSKISKKATKAGDKVILSGGGTSIGLIVGAVPVSLLALPVGLGMLGAGAPALLGTLVATATREEAVTKKLKKEADGHLQAIEALAQSVDKTKNELIENRKDDIIHSPFFEQVLETPSLSKLFIKAAAQKLSQYKEKEEAVQKATDAAKPATNPKVTLMIPKAL